MNIPPPSTYQSKPLSKSWHPDQSIMDCIDLNHNVMPRLNSDSSRIDPIAESSEGRSLDNYSQSVISVRKGLQRRSTLSDALGSNFGRKVREESEGVVCSVTSSLIKKRANVCTSCGTTDTPSWRRSKDDNRNLLCNACGLRNRSDRKKHKSAKKPKGIDKSTLPPSPVDSQSQSPFGNFIMPWSPLSPLIPHPVDLSNQSILFDYNDPLSLLFLDDLTFDSM